MTVTLRTTSRACLVCGAPVDQMRDGLDARVCRRTECQWTIRTTPAHRACRICSRPLLTRQIADRVCHDPECRRAYALILRAGYDENVVRIRKRVAALGAAIRQRSAPTVGVSDPESYHTTAVPRLVRKLHSLPKKRRAALRDHLGKLVDQVLAHRAATLAGEYARPIDPPADSSVTLPDDVATVLGKACAMCKGECCSRGGNHAYLRIDAISHYMDAHPEKSRDEIVNDYLGRLGARTVHDSCAYHGAKGCTLPREMRSNICNTFYCSGLMDFRGAVEAGAPAQAFMFFIDTRGSMSGAFVDAREVRVARKRASTV